MFKKISEFCQISLKILPYLTDFNPQLMACMYFIPTCASLVLLFDCPNLLPTFGLDFRPLLPAFIITLTYEVLPKFVQGTSTRGSLKV